VTEEQVAVLERGNRFEQPVTWLGLEHTPSRTGNQCLAKECLILYKREDESVGVQASPAHARSNLDAISNGQGEFDDGDVGLHSHREGIGASTVVCLRNNLTIRP
jgi:hypothetical protein